MQHELELIGKEEFTKANMAEIIEHYYTANEDCIPISKLKEIVDLYDNTLQCTRKYNQELANILCDLEELLEESDK